MISECRIILAIALGGLVAATQAFAQCTKDTDCKGDRVCVNGSCTDPSAHAKGAPSEGFIGRWVLSGRCWTDSSATCVYDISKNGPNFILRIVTQDCAQTCNALEALYTITSEGNLKSEGLLSHTLAYQKDADEILVSSGGGLQRLRRVRSSQAREVTRPSAASLAPQPRTANPSATRSLQELRDDLAAGKDVTLPVRFVSGAVDSSRYARIYGGLYLADGTLKISKTALTFEPSVGASGFTVTPDKILLAEHGPTNPSRLHLKIAIANKKGKEKPQEFFLFNAGAEAAGDIAGSVGGPGASIVCGGCDESMTNASALLDAIRGKQ